MHRSLAEIDKDINDSHSKMSGIIATAEKESGGRLSAEQRKDYDAAEKLYDSALVEKQELADDARRKTALAKKASEAKNLDDAVMLGRQTNPEQFRETRIEAVSRKPFANLGEQLQAIAHAGINGDNPATRDPRLIWNSYLAPVSGGAVAGIPSDGGYLIQKEFLGELVTRMNDVSILKPRVRTIPISGNSDGLKILAVNETSRATGSRWGGVQVYWGAEADAATAKKPQFRVMELELHDLIGLCYLTDRLLSDASAIQAIFQTAFTEEMGFMCDDSLVNGTGAGMPMGLLNAPATVSVSKETNQAAATIVYENVRKMWSRLHAKSRANSVWLINQDTEPQLHSISFPVGTGGVPVFMPPGGLSSSPYASLFGRPIIPHESCATLGTVGDIILADYSQYLAIEKGGIQADSSIHVRFTTFETAFRFKYRYDAQPIWNSALTPFKGTATQSPFVTLATRS